MIINRSPKNTTKDTILISYASKGREDYNKGLLRLIDSVSANWPYHSAFFSLDGGVKEHNGMHINLGELPQPQMFTGKPHKEIPYQFKLQLIQVFRELGYTKIVWLDSSLQLVKDCTPLLSNGVMAFHNLGHPLIRWISDEAAKNLDCEPYLHEIEQTWGGAIGFDFNQPKANDVFDELVLQSAIGSFNEGGSTREGFIAHRHDQAVLSVLLHDYGIPLIPYGKIVTHPHDVTGEYGTDFYIKHKSMDA